MKADLIAVLAGYMCPGVPGLSSFRDDYIPTLRYTAPVPVPIGGTMLNIEIM